MRIKDLAATRIRYGQRRIYLLLRREGWHVNIKRVARIYRAEGLAIRSIYISVIWRMTPPIIEATSNDDCDNSGAEPTFLQAPRP